MQVRCLENFKLAPLANVWPQMNRLASLRMDGVVGRGSIWAACNTDRGLVFKIEKPANYLELLAQKDMIELSGNPVSHLSHAAKTYYDNAFNGEGNVSYTSTATPLVEEGYLALDYTEEVIEQIASICNMDKSNLLLECERYPDLAATRINTWMRDVRQINKKRKKQLEVSDVSHTIRCYLADSEFCDQGIYDGVLRTIRSNQFHVGLDAPDLISVVCRLMQVHKNEWADVDVKVSASDKRCHIVVTNRSLTKVTEVGKKVAARCYIKTSDVGYSNLVIDYGAEVLACENGMRIFQPMKKKHLGKRSQIDSSFYSNRTKMLQDVTVLSEMEDILTYCFDDMRFQKVIDKMSENERVETTKEESENVFNAMVCNLKIDSEKANDFVMQFLEEQNPDNSPNRSKDGVVQAITAIGRDCAYNVDYEKALMLEEVGGKIFSMDNSLYRELCRMEDPKKGSRLLDKVEALTI